MPFYRYTCDSCGYQKSVFHGISEAPTVTCDSCGKTMRRTISRVGVIFKGSGFYITDSRNESKKNESKKEEAA
ncbi:FmdB family zinc ribbon protein [Pseudothermotoga thermarum]|uniref:Regulatory protein, FmdB family n=1 Tax=Pseudothermotoga thermarum DSM 5069 TaxID=688269 RepID=F7YV97_9THEM|nr:FmdB family zinc ribbon protein [Pseudothermotoga thermarum]AEH50398.1 regulatory protein, FmdB family [Pseudothermotoga thermarum DSM 5069]